MKLLVRSAFIIIAIAAVIAAILLIFSETEENSAVEQSPTPTDSTVHLEDTPVDTTNEDTTEKPVRPQQSLPPGHARVEISITEVDNGIMTAVIHRVLGYGSSTKPLASGQQLSINAATYLKNTSTDTSELKNEHRLATVSMRQTPDLGNSGGGTEWVLVKLAN